MDIHSNVSGSPSTADFGVPIYSESSADEYKSGSADSIGKLEGHSVVYVTREGAYNALSPEQREGNVDIVLLKGRLASVTERLKMFEAGMVRGVGGLASCKQVSTQRSSERLQALRDEERAIKGELRRHRVSPEKMQSDELPDWEHQFSRTWKDVGDSHDWIPIDTKPSIHRPQTQGGFGAGYGEDLESAPREFEIAPVRKPQTAAATELESAQANFKKADEAALKGREEAMKIQRNPDVTPEVADQARLKALALESAAGKARAVRDGKALQLFLVSNPRANEAREQLIEIARKERVEAKVAERAVDEISWWDRSEMANADRENLARSSRIAHDAERDVYLFDRIAITSITAEPRDAELKAIMESAAALTPEELKFLEPSADSSMKADPEQRRGRNDLVKNNLQLALVDAGLAFVGVYNRS